MTLPLFVRHFKATAASNAATFKVGYTKEWKGYTWYFLTVPIIVISSNGILILSPNAVLVRSGWRIKMVHLLLLPFSIPT